jgi:hypothetical protein
MEQCQKHCSIDSTGYRLENGVETRRQGYVYGLNEKRMIYAGMMDGGLEFDTRIIWTAGEYVVHLALLAF